MWTRRYRGLWIHGYFDRDACRWGEAIGGYQPAKSFRAAQIAITRSIRRTR